MRSIIVSIYQLNVKEIFVIGENHAAENRGLQSCL